MLHTRSRCDQLLDRLILICLENNRDVECGVRRSRDRSGHSNGDKYCVVWHCRIMETVIVICPKRNTLSVAVMLDDGSTLGTIVALSVVGGHPLLDALETDDVDAVWESDGGVVGRIRLVAHGAFAVGVVVGSSLSLIGFGGCRVGGSGRGRHGVLLVRRICRLGLLRSWLRREVGAAGGDERAEWRAVGNFVGNGEEQGAGGR